MKRKRIRRFFQSKVYTNDNQNNVFEETGCLNIKHRIPMIYGNQETWQTVTLSVCAGEECQSTDRLDVESTYINPFGID